MLRVVLAVFLLLAPSVAAADITGKARVVDGDTIWIGEMKIRLHGIDAPEMKQTCRTSKGKEQLCGQLAKQALQRLIQGQDITCKGDERDRYGRLIAVCYTGPYDLNAKMVRQGWALAYRRYSMDYVDDENAAKVARKGLWRGEFVPPWEWRNK
jgi:endonuclease YncB( thermonuclease family)